MDIKESFNQLKLLHGALFIGIITFVGAGIIIHNITGIGDSMSVLPAEAFYLILMIAVGAMYMSDLLFRKQVSQLGANLSLQERLDGYRRAGLLRAALIESAALVTGIGYLLTGDMLYLFLCLAPIALFMYTFPKDQNLVKDLDLTYSEQTQLGIERG